MSLTFLIKYVLRWIKHAHIYTYILCSLSWSKVGKGWFPTGQKKKKKKKRQIKKEPFIVKKSTKRATNKTIFMLISSPINVAESQRQRERAANERSLVRTGCCVKLVPNI